MIGGLAVVRRRTEALRRRVAAAVGAGLDSRSGGLAPDAGSAIVEFLGISLVLLVPLVYLALVLGEFQAAAFAVDGAAREAVRAVITADDADDAAARASAAVEIALADQGVDADAADVLTVRCPGDCPEPGSTVDVLVRVDVDLPGVPSFVSDAVPLSVPVSATASGVVDTYVGR